MNTSDFHYVLPEELIAQVPLDDRSDSRLLVMDRCTGQLLHTKFATVVDCLKPGDCLVLNDTKVIPARLKGRLSNGSNIEMLLIRELKAGVWQALVKKSRKAKVGQVCHFGSEDLSGVITEVGTDGICTITFRGSNTYAAIRNAGEIPLPPYIKTALADNERYNTVYANSEGSVAAPTAGLHFTEALLKQVADKGVNIVCITLHVGLGTFRPVRAERIAEHHMHSEFFEVSKEAAESINRCRSQGGRIVAVGTTVVRALEAAAEDNGLEAKCGWTDIFIYPGHLFKVVDGLITNFHLPSSTLIMLVSAFSSRETVLNAYAAAVQEKYRFFSFGDAMLII